MRRRAFLGGAVFLTGLSACGSSEREGAAVAAEVMENSRALTRLLDEITVTALRERPELATALGVDRAVVGEPFESRLGDLSRQALERRAKANADFLKRASEINGDRLAGRDVLAFASIQEAFKRATVLDAFGYGAYGAIAASPPGGPYIVTQISGAYLTGQALQEQSVGGRAEALSYLGRMESLAQQIDAETARIQEDQAKGVVPPRFIVSRTLNRLRALAGTPAPATAVVRGLQGRTAELIDVRPAEIADFARRAIEIMRDRIQPALQRQIAALSAAASGAAEEPGVRRLPNGEAYYRAALAVHATRDLDPQQLHEKGKEMVAARREALAGALDQAGFSGGTAAERLRRLAASKDQAFPSGMAGGQLILAELDRVVDRAGGRLAAVFDTFPRATVGVASIETPLGAYYRPPALKNGRRGLLFVDVSDPARWPRFMLPTLAHHEATPGHHIQATLAQETLGLPLLQSSILHFGAFHEGWAVYAEQLADEIGLYDNDPLGRIGYLQSMLMRAARVVIDTGLHALGWTREEAVRYLVETTGEPRSNAEDEVDRYCVWPGQACSYMIGYEAFAGAREKAKRGLGDRFDLKRFHDAVLLNGSLPLDALEAHLERWMELEKAKQ